MRIRVGHVARVAALCGLVIGPSRPAFGQVVQVQIDPQAVSELRTALHNALQSDLGREIAEAMRDAVRETTRALPALNDLAEERGWQNRNFTAEQTDRETRTLSLGPTGTLDLKNISGNITVTAGSGRDITIEIVRQSHGRTEADAKQGLEYSKVDVTTRGDHATVEVQQPHELRPAYSVSVAYTVTAPAGTHLTISSVSGDVSVKGITGEVSSNVISGSIKITDGANVSSATTISGDVTLTNVNVTGPLNVTAVSGEVTLTQVKCRRLTASVISGSLIGHEISADAADLKSMSGNVEYSGPLAHGGRYSLQTHSGSVKLTVAGSVGFDLDASTFSGQIRVEPPLQLEHATLTRRSARGTVGDGGAAVTATAFSGDVVIVKK